MEYHEFQSVASLSHCESFHCSCICMAQVPCLVTFVLFSSFHPHVIHVWSRDGAKEVRILKRYVRWNSDVYERSWVEYEPNPRHAELIVKSLSLESAKGVTTPSVRKRLEETGRGVGDVSTGGRIADETLSQRGDEGSVFVTRHTGSVMLSKGAGERHAETYRTIDDQSEALPTVSEETSTTGAVVRRTDVHNNRVW